MKNKKEKQAKIAIWKKAKEKVKGKHILEWLSLLIAVASLGVAILVRNDTAELTKLSDKSLYYTIRLYPAGNELEYELYGKTLRLGAKLVVDDFKIKKDHFLDVNYNSVFTHVKYFLVYDYKIEEPKNQYYYARVKLDDKTEATMRVEGLENIVSDLCYSITPNQEFCYILINTQTNEENNLDLIFFANPIKEGRNELLVEENENGEDEIKHERIDKDVSICQEYFTELWSEGKKEKVQDIQFMFDIYKDLEKKI